MVQNPNPWAGKPVGETWPRRRTQDCSETTAATGQRGTSSQVGLTTSYCSEVPDKREQRKSSLPAMLPSALTESVIRQFIPEELTLTPGSYMYITFCVSVKFPWKEETL